jgi:glyoxylase-like metal-dependent hydrolase (beta-lactamase superfamily II)
MRRKLGKFELIGVTDGIYQFDGGAMFGVVPKVLWEKKMPADEKNRIDVALNSVVVKTGKHTVLIETGLGNKLPAKMVSFFGMPAGLMESLEAAEISPEEIDVVINSHLHFDHCGWNTVRKNGKIVPTFPNATYYAQEAEWRHGRLQLERDAVSYISENYDPLVESGQMKLVNGDQEIVPGVSVRVYRGHTESMQAIMVQSEGETACYISDLIPTIAHLDLPWVMAFDLEPLISMESKKRFYAEAIPGKWLTMFTHDPEMPWVYLEKNAQGKVVARAADAEPVPQRRSAALLRHGVRHSQSVKSQR